MAGWWTPGPLTMPPPFSKGTCGRLSLCHVCLVVRTKPLRFYALALCKRFTLTIALLCIGMYTIFLRGEHCGHNSKRSVVCVLMRVRLRSGGARLRPDACYKLQAYRLQPRVKCLAPRRAQGTGLGR